MWWRAFYTFYSPGSESAATTKIEGKANPIPIPIAWHEQLIVIAKTLSFGPNQNAASFPGAEQMKGCPIAAKVWPTYTQAKL